MTINQPVVFFVFKRYESTEQFLEIIKSSGVKKIYVFADGPRTAVEKLETDRVRNIIKEFAKNNSDIQFILEFAAKNLGLKKNIIAGLSQVFAQEPSAIILEDDCLPALDFFRFTSEMLSKYKDDRRVMSINGTSVGGSFPYSYDFTKYAQCWGWATWARAWKLYDPTLTGFDTQSWSQLVQALNLSWLLRLYFGAMLGLIKKGWVSTWDFQWSYAHFVNHGLAISPFGNLVTNIGFGSAATNTKIKTRVANMPSGDLVWPLTHPDQVVENISISSRIERHFYQNPVAILGLIRQYAYYYWSRLWS